MGVVGKGKTEQKHAGTGTLSLLSHLIGKGKSQGQPRFKDYRSSWKVTCKEVDTDGWRIRAILHSMHHKFLVHLIHV